MPHPLTTAFLVSGVAMALTGSYDFALWAFLALAITLEVVRAAVIGTIDPEELG